VKRVDVDRLESALAHLIAGLEDLKAVVASLEADEEREPAPPPPAEPERRNPEGYLTVTQAAELLRCHPDTVRSMIARGELAAVKIGHAWRIDANSLPMPERATPTEFEIPHARPRRQTNDLMESYRRRVKADEEKTS
jgi:excisionase family DNA binding protein